MAFAALANLLNLPQKDEPDLSVLAEAVRRWPEEGALYLLRCARVIPKDQSLEATGEAGRALARKISTETDGLPLALDQAGAFLEEAPSTLAEYLALYRAEGALLRARRGKLAPGHPSATITFSVAFARVAAANPVAAELVRGC
jgi:hypothetical protein